MRCTSCGSFLPDGTSRCPYCGSTVSAFKAQVKTETFELEKENNGADVFESTINGVLEIFCKGNNNASWSGSGFIVSPSGYAVTNAHVAASEDGEPVKYGNMFVKVCNCRVKAKVIAVADRKAGVDLAVIKLDEMPVGSKALKIEDYNAVRNGEQIYIIGNSLGRGTCITSGIVSDKNRDGTLMYDCPTNPGNSGGPVINSDGKVIGVHFSGQRVPMEDTHGDIIQVKAQGMNYAVPSNVLMAFLKKTIDYK